MPQATGSAAFKCVKLEGFPSLLPARHAVLVPEQVPGFSDDLPWAMRTALRVIGALQRARQRRALSLLDRRLLDDIGVSPEEARAEARKPPWRS